MRVDEKKSFQLHFQQSLFLYFEEVKLINIEGITNESLQQRRKKQRCYFHPLQGFHLITFHILILQR